jgi:serine/threonine-protein kinase
MAAAHDRGIIHRDVKPANVFCTTRAGEADFVKIVDFGIAKLVDEEGRGEKGVTQTGTVLGSIEYISPEQARGETPDHRGDIYSVGVLMYELLTGRLPFKGKNRLATLNSVMFDEPLSLRTVCPDAEIPSAVDELVLQTIGKLPAIRPQSMRELADAIESLDPGVIEEPRDRSGTVGWMILGGGLAVIAGGVVVWLALRGEADQAPGGAPAPAADAAAVAVPEPAPGAPAADPPGPAPTPEPTPVAPPGPEVQAEKASVRPASPPRTLPAKTFEKQVNALLPRVRRCAEEQGAAVGTVIPVDVDVAGATGRITRVELGDGHGGTPLGDCVAALVERLSFRPFRDEKATFKFRYKI